MQHGRDNEEREQKVGTRRSRNTPEKESFEAEMLHAGRHHGTPHQHVYGAHPQRTAPAAELEEDEPVGDGAEVAPTRLAEERERERHRNERRLGRLAAGAGENLRDRREPGVSREDLERAAAEADLKVVGRAVGHSNGSATTSSSPLPPLSRISRATRS